MAFNSKYPYMRLIDDTSRHNKGTQTIQTSGDLSSVEITGDAILCQDYPTHSYHVIPLDTTSGTFTVQGSNDNEHWDDIISTSFDRSTTGAFVEGNWYAAYLRPIATGSAGNLLINEVHRV